MHISIVFGSHCICFKAAQFMLFIETFLLCLWLMPGETLKVLNNEMIDTATGKSSLIEQQHKIMFIKTMEFICCLNVGFVLLMLIFGCM